MSLTLTCTQEAGSKVGEGVGLAPGVLGVSVGQVRGSSSGPLPEAHEWNSCLSPKDDSKKCILSMPFDVLYLPPFLLFSLPWPCHGSLSSEIQVLLESNGSRQLKPHNWDSRKVTHHFCFPLCRGRGCSFPPPADGVATAATQTPATCSVVLRRQSHLVKFLPRLYIQTHLYPTLTGCQILPSGSTSVH